MIRYHITITLVLPTLIKLCKIQNSEYTGTSVSLIMRDLKLVMVLGYLTWGEGGGRDGQDVSLGELPVMLKCSCEVLMFK